MSTRIPLARFACQVVLCCGASLLGWAQYHFTTSASYTTSLPIPDNNLAGVADTRLFSSPIQSITEVKITLDIQGGYNGDLYGYLTYGTGFAVLLNRTGRTASAPFGYADSGFSVTLADAAPNGDIHNYQLTLDPGGSALTGTWQPDARNVHPATALDTTARGAFLNAFNTFDPNGSWTLYLADVSPVGTATLTGWGLEISGTSPIPEPGGLWPFLALGAAAVGFRAWQRRGAITVK
ncbi:MAG: PEP-CTERM sorting domain-containing protein [Verrucomicrobia bacterium]|nr:PEP-CTERM sorting domain-containing protein [Verrucomicrobiota bacterium]